MLHLRKTTKSIVPTLLVLGVCLILGPETSLASRPGGLPAAGPPAEADYVAGEVLVKFRDGIASRARSDLRTQLKVRQASEVFGGSEHWVLGSKWTTKEAVSAFRDHPALEFIEPNFIYRAAVVPDDPLYPHLWGLNNTGQTCGTPGADIDAERAWNITTGSQPYGEVVIAVIDGGMDYTHPDLAPNIWSNPGEIPDNGIDDDNNGYVDDVRGWDFFNNDNDPINDPFHGTHVAGTIGAVGDNGTGVVGVNWNVRIMPLKFLGPGGHGDSPDAANAIGYAVMMGARVTNNSWGGYRQSQALENAIALANYFGVLVVAAAGNGTADNDQKPFYPASYTSPNIISVAATDDTDSLAYFSNWGVTSVDLGAPGQHVLSTAPGESYLYLNGTSMATPHVSGVAGLILAAEPGLSGSEVKDRILDNVDPVPALQGITVTGGRLNAFRTLAVPDATPPAAITDLLAAPASSSRLALGWTATGDDDVTGRASVYDLRYALSPIADEAAFEAAIPVTDTGVPKHAGQPETLEVTGLDAGTTYHFAVRALDEWENPGPLGNSAAGTTLAAPHLDSSPESFAVTLSPGSSTTRILALENLAPGTTLDWEVLAANLAGPPEGGPHGTAILSCDAGACPDQSVEVVSHPVYRFVDSDRLGDGGFTWEDITQDPGHVLITNLTGDNEVSEIIELGMDFPFFGNIHTHLQVSTDGWLVVGEAGLSANPAAVSRRLPGEQAPENIIAPFWTDLDFGGVARASYLGRSSCPGSGNPCFIVQYDGPSPYAGCSTDAYTFQVVLEDTGDIRFRYLSMPGLVAGASIGIQNDTRTTGLQVAYYEDFVHDELEVLLTPSPSWLTASPVEGMLPGMMGDDVTLAFDASNLPTDSYLGTLRLRTNDPVDSLVAYPLSLEVVEDVPRLVLANQGFREGETLQFRSCQGFSGYMTSHGFTGLLPPAGAGFFELEAEGNFATKNQTATLIAEGFPIGSVAGKVPVGGLAFNCPACRHGVFPATRALLELLLADGVLDPLEVVNSYAVSPYLCNDNRHGVRLNYQPQVDALRFGAVLAGGSAQRSFSIENRGSTVLLVDKIISESPSFTVFPASLTLPPGGAEEVTVTYWTSVQGGPEAGTLSIGSNDPYRSVAVMTLEGYGGTDGAILVDPANLVRVLSPGSQDYTPVVIWNGENRTVSYTATIAYGGTEGYLTIHPAQGTLEARSGLEAGLLIDATGLESGVYGAMVTYAFDDPSSTTIIGKVTVTVPGGKH